MSPHLQKTLDYIKGLIASGRPFQASTASMALKMSGRSVSNVLTDLKRAGLIRCEYRRGKATIMRVKIDGLGATPWPDEASVVRRVERVDFLAEEQRIAAEREKVERERMERRQSWLAREFRGRGRGPAASSFDPYAAAVARAYRTSL